MGNRKMIVVLLILLIISNAVWYFNTIDKSVSLNYSREQNKLLKKDLRIISDIAITLICKDSIYSNEEMELKIKNRFNDELIGWENNILYVDNIGLLFESNTLKKIVHINDEF